MISRLLAALALATATGFAAAAQAPHLDDVDAAVQPLIEAGHFPGAVEAVSRKSFWTRGLGCAVLGAWHSTESTSIPPAPDFMSSHAKQKNS